ncbi:MAG: hypothetical protein AAGG00_11255 [Cyanobacteria bacterium P01_H01_bin.150]
MKNNIVKIVCISLFAISLPGCALKAASKVDDALKAAKAAKQISKTDNTLKAVKAAKQISKTDDALKAAKAAKQISKTDDALKAAKAAEKLNETDNALKAALENYNAQQKSVRLPRPTILVDTKKLASKTDDEIVKSIKQIAKQKNQADELAKIEKLSKKAITEVDEVLKNKAHPDKIIRLKESCKSDFAEEIADKGLEAIKERKVKDYFSTETVNDITVGALRSCITKQSNSQSFELEIANQVLGKIEDGLENKREFQQK